MAKELKQSLSVRGVLQRAGRPLTFAEIKAEVSAKEEHLIHAQLTRLRRSYRVGVLGMFEETVIQKQEPKFLWIVPLLPESVPVSEILRQAKCALTEADIIERAGTKHLGIITAEIVRLQQTGKILVEKQKVGEELRITYRWKPE